MSIYCNLLQILQLWVEICSHIMQLLGKPVCLVGAKEDFWIGAKLRFVFLQPRVQTECKPCNPSSAYLIRCILHFMSAAVVQCWWPPKKSFGRVADKWKFALRQSFSTQLAPRDGHWAFTAARWRSVGSRLEKCLKQAREVLEASGCITHTADALALASLSVSVEIRAENAPYQRRMPAQK